MEFLKSIDLDSILQQLVRDALDLKPDDALVFAAEWTRKKLSQRAGGAVSRNSPLCTQQSTDTVDSSAEGAHPTMARKNSSPGASATSDSGRRSTDNVLKSQLSIDIARAKKSPDSDLDVNDASSVVLYSWRMRIQDESDHFMLDFCDLVLNVLFTEHPSLRCLFVDDLHVSPDDASQNLAILLSQIIYRNATPAQVAKQVLRQWNQFAPPESPRRTTILLLRQRHFHYLLCCILYAAECVFTRSTWKQIGADWLKVFGDTLQEVQNAVFDEQVVVASFSSKDALDSEFERSILLTATSLTRHSAVDVVKGVWLGMSAAQQEKICRKFFAVLFTQHRTVIRLFVDEDRESFEGDSLVDRAPVKELQVILTQVLRGFLSLEGISQLAARHAVEGGVPQRYLHYALSCMLTALGLELGPSRMEPTVADAWRVFITRLLDAVAEGIEKVEEGRTKNEAAAGDQQRGGGDDDVRDKDDKRGEITAAAKNRHLSCSRSDAEGSRVCQEVDSGLKLRVDDPPKLESMNAGSAFDVAAECWSALRDRQSASEISETFFNILFTQHPAMAKTTLKNNGELSELMAFLPSLFPEVCRSELAEADLREMGAKLTGRGIDEQKAEHAIAAAMSVFAVSLGISVFREREEALQTVCRFITDNVLFGIQNSAAVLAARAPEVIVNECWLAVVDKGAVIRKATEVMKIQHRSLARDLVDDVEDVDAFVALCVQVVTKILSPAGLSHDEVKGIVETLKAKCAEKQRPFDKKIATYIAFSFQSAIGIILGSSRFETVSHHWNRQMEKITKKFSDLM